MRSPVSHMLVLNAPPLSTQEDAEQRSYVKSKVYVTCTHMHVVVTDGKNTTCDAAAPSDKHAHLEEISSKQWT